MNRIKRTIEKEVLRNVEVTYEGSKYAPVTHREVIDTIDQFLSEKGISLRKESYLTASNGQRMVGKLVLDCPDTEGGYLISYKNSCDGSMSFGMASGFFTFICSNGSVFGSDSSFKKKHMGSAKEQILHQISFVIDKMEEVMKKQVLFREELKEIEVSKKLISELCGRLYMDDQIIQANQLSLIKKEIEIPTYDYKCKGSAYEFYQHCTFAVRETTPILWHKQHEALSNFFVNQFGVLKEKEVMTIEALVEQEKYLNQA